MLSVEKLRLVLDLVGALSLVCTLFAALLPEGKPKEVLKRLGFMAGEAVKAARK